MQEEDYISEARRLQFTVPTDATPEQRLLAADIITLDHRAYTWLKPGTRQWSGVLALLHEAANMGLTNRSLEPARKLYDRAEATYVVHLQANNRLRYMLGIVIGGPVVAYLALLVLWDLGFGFGNVSNLTYELLILYPFIRGNRQSGKRPDENIID